MVDLTKPIKQPEIAKNENKLDLTKPIDKKHFDLYKAFPELESPQALGKSMKKGGAVLASVVQPELGFISKVLPNIPKIAKVVSRIGAQSSYGAMAAPESPELGAGLGAFGSALTQLGGNKSPVVNAIVRALSGGIAGGAGGFAVGGIPGALGGATAGASAALGAPSFAKRLGFNVVNPTDQILNNVSPKEVYKKTRAANALNTDVSPGEASGRADLTAQEAKLGRVGEGAAERVKIGNERIVQQKNAINTLENTISPNKTNALLDTRQAARNSIDQMKGTRQERAAPLYEKAYQEAVEPKQIIDLMNSDKTIANAINAARNDAAYSVELKGYAPNSIKLLDVAKKKIGADIEKAIKNKDMDRARVLKASSDRLTSATDKFSPTYKAARRQFEVDSPTIDALESGKLGQIANVKDVGVKNISKMIFDPAQTDINVLKTVRDQIRSQNPEAWDNLVKNELTRLMSKGEVKGSTFYKNVLENDNVFNQLITSLDHNPTAKKQLIYMRRAWKDLTNVEDVRKGHGLSATGMKQARNDFDKVLDMYAELTGSVADIKALRTIYTKEWQSKLSDIAKMKDRGERSVKMGELLSSIIRGSLSTAASNK